MRKAARQDVDWETPSGSAFTWDHVKVELLMDIRQELYKMNRIINCHNFIAIPRILRSIQRNTTKKKRKVTKS